MNTILGLLFGVVGSPYTAPETLYFGLATGAIAANGTVTGEPASGSYARKSVTNDTALWNTAANGALDNKIAITFVTATASWGTILNFFIANHLTNTGAAIIAYGTLTVSKAITTGDTASFAIGDLDISLTATA
jgi:hypothetical protein